MSVLYDNDYNRLSFVHYTEYNNTAKPGAMWNCNDETNCAVDKWVGFIGNLCNILRVSRRGMERGLERVCFQLVYTVADTAQRQSARNSSSISTDVVQTS